MNVAKILNSYERTAREWIDALPRYTTEHYFMEPAAGEWSLAQVYDHVTQVSNVCMANARACIAGGGQVKTIAIGPAIFSAMGSFPPFRLKITKIPAGMEKVYNPQPITKAQAVEQLNQTVAEMKLLQAELEHYTGNNRVKHWAGGWFNARQWFQSSEMHLRHHQRQQQRIEQGLKRLKL